MGKYFDFVVYEEDNKYVFAHMKMQDTEEFYEKIFDFFFDENRLIKYAESNFHLEFNPTRKNYVTLYKHLQVYIDKFNLESININELEEEIFKVLNEEYQVFNKEGKLYIKNDKVGKIGEYIFSSLLNEYFEFDCIIPKVHLQTSYNMSIYGIDTLFYESKNNFLLFGESKVSKNIENGITMINKSLSDYDSSLKQEYKLVLSNRLYKDKLNIFNEKYGDLVENAIEIEEFIKEAKIEKIGIPIFIMHGNETDIKYINDNLNKISKKKLLGLETIYYFISLPVIDKSKLLAIITKKIKEKEEEYRRNATDTGS